MVVLYQKNQSSSRNAPSGSLIAIVSSYNCYISCLHCKNSVSEEQLGEPPEFVANNSRGWRVVIFCHSRNSSGSRSHKRHQNKKKTQKKKIRASENLRSLKNIILGVLGFYSYILLLSESVWGIRCA